MDTFLWVLSAVLLILTAVFAFVVTKVLATQRAEDDQRFTYTKDVMTSLSGDVKSLHMKLDTTLIPRLDAVYGQLSDASPSLTPSGFLNMLKTLGYQASQVADNQNPMFFLGIAHEGVNISIFIGFNLTDPVIAFRSFAFATTELPERALLALLALNASTAVSSIGVISLKNKYVITADCYFPVPTRIINPQVIFRLTRTLIDRQFQISKTLREHGVTATQILANEYVDALPVDPATGMKFIFIGAPPENAPTEKP